MRLITPDLLNHEMNCYSFQYTYSSTFFCLSSHAPSFSLVTGLLHIFKGTVFLLVFRRPDSAGCISSFIRCLCCVECVWRGTAPKGMGILFANGGTPGLGSGLWEGRESSQVHTLSGTACWPYWFLKHRFHHQLTAEIYKPRQIRDHRESSLKRQLSPHCEAESIKFTHQSRLLGVLQHTLSSERQLCKE